MNNVNFDPKDNNSKDNESQDNQTPDTNFPNVWDTVNLSLPDIDISTRDWNSDSDSN
ncbi:hypothetical protein GCM10028826_13980 [Mucilaginibacter boryungensis]